MSSLCFFLLVSPSVDGSPKSFFVLMKAKCRGIHAKTNWLDSSNVLANRALLLGKKSIVKIAFEKWSDVDLAPFGCPGFHELTGIAVSPLSETLAWDEG